ADRSILKDPKAMQEYIERSYLLAQRGYYANSYGDFLITQGNTEGARGVAELTRDDLLRIKILFGTAQYGQVLSQAPKLLHSLPATEEYASLAFQLANEAVRAAHILERPTDFVDEVVSRYVTSEPHHIVDGVLPFVSLINVCCYAPKETGRRCIDRIEQLR